MQPQLISGRYQVLRAIGRGGMGTVWLCRDQVLGRKVAVKQIGALPGESVTETKRAMREARSAASVNHSNAVAVYDVVDHDGGPWLVMEYVEGETLADEISREGKISPQRVAEIGAQLAGALARAHERRIVHRDIKPGNVLIDRAGRPKISDFGIARGHGDDQLTQIGFITGTPGYLSPELARGGDPHPASDVWALGATLYAAVEGQAPYESRSNPIALLRAIATTRPRPMTYAGALTPAIDAMMHEDPACRWDMATSARRLGGIARAGTPVVRREDRSATKVLAVVPLEPTQALATTQRLEVPGPVSPAQTGVAAASAPEVLNVAGGVTKASVFDSPVVKPPVVKPPVVKPPVVKPPVVKPAAAAKPPVVRPPVVVPAAAAKPMVVTASVAEGRVVVAPVTTSPGVAEAEAVKSPVVAAPVVLSPVVATSGVAGVPVPEVLREWGSGRRLKPILLVALLVAVLGSAYLLLSLVSDQSGTTATPGANRASASTPTAGSTPKASEAPSATARAPRSTVAVPARSSDERLASFISSYYATVTTDRDVTWAQLSPTMQAFAKGRNGYDGFWQTVRSVRVNQVDANASARSAVVNLTYTMRNGRTRTETHSFAFVTNGAGYLIQTDR